ncbi:MAG: sulfur modification protein DndD [Thermosipho sp. (in: thermotogales)]|nr:sulfur modification protein DndD [Thermosipho sp. (in: thermotogales)]
MRIKKIVLKNYRQFKDIEILLSKTHINDLHIFIGVMGTGKTNLLNAINWCLYGDESYLSRDFQQLPLPNLKVISETEYEKDVNVVAEVWIETENNSQIIFTRKSMFRVYNRQDIPQRQAEVFEVKITNNEGNTKILEGEDAESCVERFVPKKIREFFFFDGEKLDRYFREATGQNIRHTVSAISQVEMLSELYRKIEIILKEFRKDAGKVNPKIEETREYLEQKENEYREVSREIEECEQQIAIAKEKIREYEEKLRELPDVEKLEKERGKLIKSKKEKEEYKKEKEIQKQGLLYEYGKIIMLWPAICKSKEVVKSKKMAKEIPPTIDRILLEETIKNNICTICGRKLDDRAKKEIEKLLNEISMSSEIAQELLSMESFLNRYSQEVKYFKINIEKISKEIQKYNKELEEIEENIFEIDRKLSGYNTEKIKEWHEERMNFEKIYDNNQQKLGILKSNKQQLEQDIENFKKKLDDELNREKKITKLKKCIDFCVRTLEVLDKTKEKITSEIRSNIESETKKLFFNLIWKKESFKNIKVDENYNINLIHAMGYECLGTISGGEREILTLAFTIALHKVSGFNSPIIIDRPLAMVSGEPRKNIVDTLSLISKNKQVILLFTPDDYSFDISSILDPKASNRYRFNMSHNEKEVKMEVL